MKKTLLLILILMVPSLYALTNPLEVTGRNSGLAGEFSTEVGFNARNLGMGKAGTASTADISALYYNPAALGFLDFAEMSVLYSALYFGGSYFTAGYAQPVTRSIAVGAGITGVTIGDIERFDSFGLRTGTSYSYSDLCFTLGFAGRVGKNLSLGGNFKIASEVFDTKSAFGVGLDASAIFILNRFAQFGLALQNIVGPSMQLGSKAERYPLNAKFGVAATLLDGKMTILADVGLIDLLNYAGASSFEVDSALRYKAGVEYVLLNFLPLRLGWDGTEIDGGLGFRMRNARIDYAIALHSLNLSHRISLDYRFGIPPTTKEKYLDDREIVVESKQHLLLADSFIRKGNIAEAKAELAKASTTPDEFITFREDIERNIDRAEKAVEAAKKTDEAARLFAKGDLEGAKNLLDDALILDPASKEAIDLRKSVAETLEADDHYKKASDLFIAKNYQSASEEILAALKIFPEKKSYIEFNDRLKPFINKLASVTHQGIAENLLKKHYYDRALDEVNIAMDLNPENTDAVSLKQKILYEIGSAIYNEALTGYNAGEYGTVSERCAAVTNMKAGNERFISSPFQDVIVKSIKLSRQARAKLLISLAKSSLEAKDYDKVEKELTECLKLDPENKEATEMYARLKQIKEFFK